MMVWTVFLPTTGRPSMHIVHIPASAPRDRFDRRTRVLTFAEFRGLPIPDQVVQIVQPGDSMAGRTGRVSFVHYGDERVGIRPE